MPENYFSEKLAVGLGSVIQETFILFICSSMFTLPWIHSQLCDISLLAVAYQPNGADCGYCGLQTPCFSTTQQSSQLIQQNIMVKITQKRRKNEQQKVSYHYIYSHGFLHKVQFLRETKHTQINTKRMISMNTTLLILNKFQLKLFSQGSMVKQLQFRLN